MSIINTQPDKIPSRLILYRSSRLAELRQHNLKYAYFSPNFIYSEGQPFRALQKRLLDLPKKGYINAVSCSLNSSELEDNLLMRSITKLSSIQHLSISLTPTPDSELQMRKILKKILKTCPRIKAFSLMIFASPTDASFSLKFLSFIKSVKNFTCAFWSPTETYIENLTNNLVRTQNRCLNPTNSFYFIVNPESDPENERIIDWNLFANSLERIHSAVKNSHFFLELYPPHNDMENFLNFAQRSLNLSSLEQLSMTFDFSESFSRFLNFVKESKSLQKLSLTLNSSLNSIETAIPNLDLIMIELKSLSDLDLNLENFEDSQYLPILFQKLVFSNPQLSSLSLSLQRTGGIADSVLDDLTHLLDKFDKLRYFTLHADIYAPLSSQSTATTIKNFYQKLSSLKHLKELNLSFSNQKEAGPEEILRVFCESLNSLKELRRLQLNMNSCSVTDESFIHLTNSLPNLDSLVFNFNGSSNHPISASVLKQFLAHLVDLKNLSWLELDMKVKGIDEKHAKEFITSFWGIKSLIYLSVYFETTSCSPAVQEHLEQQIQQLGRRIYINTSIKSV